MSREDTADRTEKRRTKGLGRGLGALLSSDIAIEPRQTSANQIVDLPITLIEPNEDQPRKSFDEGRLAELAASIKENGIIQPIIVTRKDSRYIIVAGERRWRAAQMVGLKTIPAIIRELTDKEVVQQSLIENIQRQDLNPIEEAEAFSMLMTEHDMTQEELAQILGRSRPAVANTLRLLQLGARTSEYVIRGEISAGHARALLAISDPVLQASMAEEIMRRDWSVRQTENRIRQLQREQRREEPGVQEENDAYSLALQTVTERLTELLGTRVKLQDRRNKGDIVISYSSLDELNRILDLIAGRIK